MSVKKVVSFTVITIFFASFLVLSVGLVFIFRAPEAAIKVIEKLLPAEKVEPVQIKGIGILGDSQADEYRGDDSRGLTYAPTTLNWVEQLQKYRSLNFGPWGVWGEPRRTGYEYNWARTGATVEDMFTNGQVAGLAEQIKAGQVNVVIISIGANDYAPYLTSEGYDAIYDGTMTDLDVLRKKNRLVADLTAAVDTLRESGDVKILLVGIPDWGYHLGVRINFPLPEPRQRATKAIAATNADLQKMADARGITTLDPNLFYTQLFSKSLAEISVGDQTLNAILPGDDPRSVFLEDGTHAGTLLNGLFANYVVTVMNRSLGTGIKPFTTRELLTAAGL